MNVVARHGFDGRRRATYFVAMIKRTVTHPLAFVDFGRATARTAAAALLLAFVFGAAISANRAMAAGERAGGTEPGARSPAGRAVPGKPDAAPRKDRMPDGGKGDVAGNEPADPAASAAVKAEPDTPTQRRRALDDLYAYLAASDSAAASVPLVAAIERLWLFSGSDTINVLMERVLKAVAEQNLELAQKLSDSIVDLEPGFAEGWNRRALVAYLQGDKENALNALQRALALEPNHFKALDGVAQILRDQGDKQAALKAYKRLLDVNPYWQGAEEAVDELTRQIEGQGI